MSKALERGVDMVKITCYGETKEMERKEAIAFYTEAFCGTEGYEQLRYMNILVGLKAGDSEVYDE